MVFFSLLHTWPRPAVVAFFISWACYIGLVLFALCITLTRFVARLSSHSNDEKRSQRFLQWMVGTDESRIFDRGSYFILIHFALTLTYERWSSALF
jgi:hypothetical protein